MPSKHTQGPFELDHATDDGNRHFIVHGQLPQGLNADFGYPICDSLNRHHCVSPEEDEANGRLFAVAPDLLNALKAVNPLLPLLPEYVRQKIEDVIAKAEGRTA